MDLHPTEHRGYRELYATARALSSHARSLAGRQSGEAAEALGRLAELGERLVAELEPRMAAAGVHAGPGAEGAARMLEGARRLIRDPLLERNQALRMCVADAEGLCVLLGYLAECGARRGDEEMSELLGSWERKVRRQEGAVRRAAIAQAASPDEAIAPSQPSTLGRVAQGTAVVVGTIGEAIDKRRERRRDAR